MAKSTSRKKTADQQPDLFAHADDVSQAVVPYGMAESWAAVLGDEFKQPYFHKLMEFVAGQRLERTVFPPEIDVFAAFRLTPFPDVRVLLLGQDPYHDDGQAHGLCFSVKPGQTPPPSLRNIFKELHDDLECRSPDNGYLVPWAEQGVMLLNAVLTVKAHAAGSHKEKGWEKFTDAVIHKLNGRLEPVVFVLWGAYARKKTAIIDTGRHTVIESAHPSPLSANNGFFGSRPFSKINAALREYGYPEIDWQLPSLQR
jgi:uracil-DNA glycosylase